MAAVGLFVGYESRGGLLGLGVPAARRRPGVGGVARGGARHARADLVGDVVGVASRSSAGVASRRGRARHRDAGRHEGPQHVDRRAAARRRRSTRRSSTTSRAIGHALAPWSAFLPFAFGRLLLAAARAARARRRERESLARVAVLVGAAVALVAHGYLAARTDLVAFSGPCPLRGGLRGRHPRLRARRARVDRRRPGHAASSRRCSTTTSTSCRRRRTMAFGITGATFPESFKDRRSTSGGSSSAASPLCAFLTWIERDAEARAVRSGDATRRSCGRCARPTTGCSRSSTSRPSRARRSPASSSSSGMRTHAHWLPQMSSSIRDVVLNAWWVVAFVPLGSSSGSSSRATSGCGPSGARARCRRRRSRAGSSPSRSSSAGCCPDDRGAPTRSEPLGVVGRARRPRAVHAARHPGRRRSSRLVRLRAASWYVAAAARRALGRGVLPRDGLRRRHAASPGARRWRSAARSSASSSASSTTPRSPTSFAQGGLRELPPGLPGRAARAPRRRRADGGVLRRRPAADAQRPDERVQLARRRVAPASAAASR